MNKSIHVNKKERSGRWQPLTVVLVILAVLVIMPTFWPGGEITAAAVTDDGHNNTNREGDSAEAPWEELKLHWIPEKQDIIEIKELSTGEIGRSMTTGTNDFIIGAIRYPNDSWKIDDYWLEKSASSKIIWPEDGESDKELLLRELDREWVLRMLIPDEVEAKLKEGYKVGVTATDAKEENLKGGSNGKNVREIIKNEVDKSVEGIPSSPRRAREFIYEYKKLGYDIALGDLGASDIIHQIDELFDLNKGALQYKLEGKYLYIKGWPKFHFRDDWYHYANIIEGYEKNTPLVNSHYGANSHTIAGSGIPIGERGTAFVVYNLDLIKTDNPDPKTLKAELEKIKGPGHLHFTHILNANGELIDNAADKKDNPFYFVAWGDGLGKPYILDGGVRIGSESPNDREFYFKGGGATVLWWWYPLELTFYLANMEDVAVTGIEFGELEPESNVDVTVMVYRAPSMDVDEAAENGDKDKDKELDTLVVFSVNGNDYEQEVMNLQYDETRPVPFSFTTPAKGTISMTAEINPEINGKREFEEVTYDNNKLTITAHIGEYGDLPYWAISRDIEFSLPTAIADIYKERGWWVGSATGTLYVYNNSPDLYRNFKADGNIGDAVRISLSGDNGRITHSAFIEATLKRPDFGDDPQNRDYADNYSYLPRMGNINTDGDASQVYEWREYCDNHEEYHYYTGTGTGYFSDVAYSKEHYADVYNGVPSDELFQRARVFRSGSKPEDKVFEIFAEKNKKRLLTDRNSEDKFNLAWEGTNYLLGWDSTDPSGRAHPATVIRWMSHINADGSEEWLYIVPGKHERTFIGQSTGTITWRTIQTMENFYDDDRERARSRATGKGNYINAVFATDLLLQNYTYPIKSGYYFNPGGIYECTVYTEQYKDSPYTTTTTKEHEELVKKVKAAFSYVSDIIYVNKNQDYGKLGPITEATSRGLLDISETKFTRYTDKDPLHATTVREDADNTDELLKEVLEGYEESETDESYDDFKYREQTDKKIWFVKEETVITVTLAVPDGQKMYTHVNMKNGDYAILVKVGGIEFNFEEYLDVDDYKHKSVLTMDAFNLDGIKVTVSGSMYNDRQ